MVRWRTALVGAILLLGNGAIASESVMATLLGEERSVNPNSQTSVAAQPEPAPQSPALAQLKPIEPDRPTGTAVGQKIDDMRKEIVKLDGSIAQHSDQLQATRGQAVANVQQYQQLIGAINARLQVGSTPANPILESQWSQAQSILEQIDGNLAAMNSLAAAIASDAAIGAFLLEAERATYVLPGAIEEDHRQLAVLQDATNKAVVIVDRLLDELAADIDRQSLDLAREHRNLTMLSVAIKNGVLFGSSLANRTYSTTGPLASAAPASGPRVAGIAGRRPLLVIRFNRANVDYEQTLYTAVSQTLQRKPTADFDLVAVAPAKGGSVRGGLAVEQSKRHADAVMRSLTNMGVSPDRVTLSATTSGAVNAVEVHLYAR